MQYKWAQLDLARQMESMDFIKEFITIMADAGYNGILLYLEDRVRTNSYPYPADSDCYTEAQMEELVAFAAKRDVEIVPCVATLGHAERFLAHPELEKLSELQGDMKGRFGWTKKQTFCPTHPEFYPFLTGYLKEVAALFPSKFFHAGLDEFWDYCLCERCRKAAPDFKAQQALFVKHIEKIHDCLAACGKRMMMWSDMFEYYPEAISRIPKDIVMIDWQYQEDVRGYLHHLFDCHVENRLEVNRKNGLDTFLGPVDMLYRNAQSYLEYAENKPYIGCLLTCWEKTDSFMYRTLPTFVYAGHLMSGKSEADATDAMMQQLFGTNDPVLTSAITLALTEGPWRHFRSIADSTLFARDFRGLPYANFEVDEASRRLLQNQSPLVKTELGRRILQDLITALDEKCASHGLARYFNFVLDGHAGDAKRFQALKAKFAEVLDTMDARWNLWRTGIAGNLFAAKKGELLEQLEKAHETLLSSRFVKVRVCVPDGYGVEHVRISLKFAEDGAWQVVADQILKPHELNTALSEHFLPYQAHQNPVAIRLEAYGMGGVGICFVEADGMTPKAITAMSCLVQSPEHLLRNDVNFAWFGSQSTAEAYFSKPLADTIHSVTLTL